LEKAKIDVFDKHFKPVTGMAFKDPNLPMGYAPFNIRNIGGMLFVTYALQKAVRRMILPVLDMAL
jgi:hypothetical protein